MLEVVHRTLAKLVVGITILTTSCSSSSTTDDNSAPAVAVEALPAELGVQQEVDLSCPGAPVDAPDELEHVFDVVALPAAPTLSALQTSRRDAADGTKFYFAKTGLWWRGNAEVEISVAPEFQPRLAIGWGGPAAPAYSINANCGLSDDDWMVAAGGYWVTEPMCAAVIVRSGAHEQRINLGIGKACPGQNPPEGPSDD